MWCVGFSVGQGFAPLRRLLRNPVAVEEARECLSGALMGLESWTDFVNPLASMDMHRTPQEDCCPRSRKGVCAGMEFVCMSSPGVGRMGLFGQLAGSLVGWLPGWLGFASWMPG